mgnify:CR=1 FL=1
MDGMTYVLNDRTRMEMSYGTRNLSFLKLDLLTFVSIACENASANYFQLLLMKSLMHPENPRTQNAGKLFDDGAACKPSQRTANRKPTHQA